MKRTISPKRKNRKNLVGQRFGKIEVIKLMGSVKRKKAHHRLWLCRCDCGNEVTYITNALYPGRVSSCGCQKLGTKNRKHELPTDASWQALFNNYKQKARFRKFDFSLAADEVRKLCSGSCEYCGALPSRSFNVYETKSGRSPRANNKSTEYTRQAQITVNGIDRIDSSIGYVATNVVSCCKTCNYAKNNMSVLEFLDWARRLATFQNRKEK
jgi:hypothetical protein